MPSGAKKRKAAKKKKIQQNNSSIQSHGEDEVKHYDEKEIDGGEFSSPVSQEYHDSFAEGEEVDLGKREDDSSSARVIAPESDSVGKEDTQKVFTEEEGVVEMNLEEDYKSKNISIESSEEVHGEDSSSSSSSCSSDDEFNDVESNTAVVETERVVDSVEPVEISPEVVTQVIESVKVEESDNEFIETDPSVKLDDSLLSIVNQVNDSFLVRETDNAVTEAEKVVNLAEPTDCSSEVVSKVNDTVLIGETRNGDVETSPLVESEKDLLIEETDEVIESASTVKPNTSCLVELDPPEVGEKKILTSHNYNAVSPEFVDLGSDNKELPPLDKAAVYPDANDSATEVKEDKLELSYNSSVGHSSNGADYQNPEYSSNQPLIASTSQTVQKTSVKSCCGIFELFTSSDR